MSVDQDRIRAAVVEILEAIGEDPDREGLMETPDRVARWWAEFVDHDPGRLDTAFEEATSGGIVVVQGIRVWSLCEHHLLPFWCDISIGYVPARRVLGLSKLARIAHSVAHSLQIQERLADEIAESVGHFAETFDVAVVAKGQHLCMCMRGVRSDATMTTTAFRGVFRSEPGARAEFFNLVK